MKSIKKYENHCIMRKENFELDRNIEQSSKKVASDKKSFVLNSPRSRLAMHLLTDLTS